MKTQTIQLDENNQIRIRFNEWKGVTKVYIQNFFRPGPSSRFPAEKDGYAFGKAVAFPPDRWQEFMEKAMTFTRDNSHHLQPVATKKTKKARPRLEEGEDL